MYGNWSNFQVYVSVVAVYCWLQHYFNIPAITKLSKFILDINMFYRHINTFFYLQYSIVEMSVYLV